MSDTSRGQKYSMLMDNGGPCAAWWNLQEQWTWWSLELTQACFMTSSGVCVEYILFTFCDHVGCVSVWEIFDFFGRKQVGGGAAWHSGCQISAPAPASIPTCISYMLAKWQATNCLLFPFTHVPFRHFCPLRSGVRLQRLLCGDPIGGISLQACAVRWYLTFCLHSLKMCAFHSEYFRLTNYKALIQNRDVLFKKA